LILFGVLLVLAVIYFPIRYFQDQSLRRSALAQARRLFDEGQTDQALATVKSYLDSWPEDYDGLGLIGELTARANSSTDQVMTGIDNIDKLLRFDPGSPARQEDRKRLVLLLIRLGDMVRAISDFRKSGLDKFEGRYQYANNIAEQRIKLGADDGEAHRLLAMTLERLALAGAPEFEAKAIKEYQKALRKDPGDVISADRLAALRMERKDGQGKPELAGADQIIDNLVKARPRSVEARLLRARHFLKTGREERAKVDLETATKLDSTNLGIRLMAAALAVRRGDATSAKRYLASIPETDRVADYDILVAHCEMIEKRPDQAIDKLRKGLARTAGTDITLTFHLAYTLIQNGRMAEARPLIDQYRRLSGRRESPMSRFLEGVLRERSGRITSAIVELEAAREEISEEWKVELELTIGRCFEATGDIDSATKAYENARRSSPSSPTPRQALARLQLVSNPDRAVEELKEAIRLGQGPGASSLVADLANAQIIRQLAQPEPRRDWSAAGATIEQGLRARPDDPTLLLIRVKLLTSSGRLDEAEERLAEATRGGARISQELWLVRARQLESRGKYEEALRVLEQGLSPSGAGDHAALRASRARLLSRVGRGRAALELLSLNTQKMTAPDRAILLKTKAEILLTLGDHAGAVASCVEWAGITPEDPAAGLALIAIARRGGTPEEIEQAIELLKKAGGGDEPRLIAAQSIAVLLPKAGESEVDTTKLDLAESMSLSLQESAPKLPSTSLIRAILSEQSSDVEDAIAGYKEAIKGDTTGLALPRLVALLNRLKRTDDLAALKDQVATPAIVDLLTIRESLGAGDKEQAETLLTKLIAAQPDRLEYYSDLVRLLRDLGKPEQAEATIRALIDRQPDRPQPWLALLSLQGERGDQAAIAATIERLKATYTGDGPNLLLARCLWAIGDRDEAARVSAAELARKPDDLEAIRLASEIDQANGRIDRAERLIARALEIDPKMVWARRSMALILSVRSNGSRWPEARALTAPGASSEGDSFEDRLIRAIVLDRGPDPASHAEAASGFRSLAEDLPILNPIGNKARLLLAENLLKARDAAGVIQVLTPLIGENPLPMPNVLGLAIEARCLEGKAEEARRLLELLTKAQPNAPMTTVCRSLVFKAEGDPQAAASAILEAAAGSEKSADGERLNRYYFDHLARIGTDDAIERLGRRIAEVWPNQGVTLARFLASKGRIDEVLPICQSAVEAGPARESIELILGLDSQGKLEGGLAGKARDLIIATALRSPKDLELFSMATALLRRHRRFDDEALFYGKLLEADPSNYAARNNLAWVLAKDLGKPADGLNEVDRVIREVGQVHQVLDTRGMILLKLGRIDEAIADFEKSTKIAPTATHQIHLARAYAQAGRVDDRKRTLEAAKRAVTNPKALDPEDLAELDNVNL
jgi:tetratricopeptide (TPR) repeat protein